MQVEQAHGFAYRGEHVSLFSTTDGWYWQVGPVTTGPFGSVQVAGREARHHISVTQSDARRRDRLTVAARGAW